MDHTVSQNAQDLIGIPHLGVSGSSTKWHSELSPTEGPHSAGSSTPGFLSPMAELSHPSPPPPALGSLPQLPDGSPTWSVLEVASDPASTQQTKAGMAGRVHSGVPLPTFKNTDTATHEAEPPLFQTAESGAVEMNSRKLAPDTANDSANPLHLSAAPENSRGPALSAEHTSSSLVPSPLHVTALGREQAILSEAVPTSPSTGTIDFPSVLTFLQPTENHASPSPVLEMPTLPAEGSHGSPPATRDLLLSGRVPNLLSTSWTFPRWKKDSVTAILRKNEEANVTIPLQAFPRKEVLSLHTVNGFVSDFSTHHVSSPIVTAPRTNPLPSGSPLPSILSIQATQTVFPSLGFSNTKPEASAAAVDHSGLPASASKQVRASPSSMDVYDSSTIGDMKKPATTDVFWSSLSAETGSLSTESIISGLQQQTNYDLNGHTISTTSWETHLAPTAPTAPPSGLTSAANAIKSQDFKDTAGHSVTAEGFSVQDLLLSTSTEQPVQQSDMTVVGSHVDLWPTSNNNHSIDFQTAGVAYYSPTTQHSVSQLQLPDQPAHPLLLTSSRPTSTGSLQEMLSDGTDTGSEMSSDLNSSPERNASTPFQNILSYHSAAESSISTSVFPRTSSRVLRASQHPKKWTVDTASSKVEPTAAAAVTLFLRKSSPPALSAALVAKGTSSSPLAVASGPAKSSSVTTLAKNGTNKAASGPKRTPGAVHTAFPFTPTYMYARTGHTTSTHTAMQGNMGTASGLLSTTYLPRKPQAMHTGLPNPTNPEMPRASTPRPLTVTAALTSITASVKATRLPPLRAENTDAALPAASAAVVTSGKMASNLECQMSSKLLVKTVLFLTQRRTQLSEALKFSIAKGLTQALRKAFHQNDVSAHVDILEYSHNVTVGYYATKGRLVYLPAVVMEMLGVYGVSNVTADLKQHTPNLQSVAVLASPWNPQPAGYFQLKTVLQFVSQADNIQSCKFAQTMEQRLQKAFQDAERKVLNTKSNLTIQIVSTSNASQAVTLVYVVGNQSTFLNGTVASSLLSQLSAELVGFYLTYPPLTIAEPLEYPNLDISETTRDYWVITVLQGVDNSLVGLHNQSFARVMEQRLAQLFMMSQQQGRRFKRATTLGSYTVQMVKMQRVPGPKDPAELTYYTLYNGKPLLGTAAAKILSTIDSQRMALTLHHVVLLQADPVVKNPPNNLWIIAAVLAPIAVVTVIIIIITAVLCRKNKNDFKPDTMINLPQRAKPVQGFDYAKQHLGQQGADEEVIPVTQETVVLPLPIRDAPQERDVAQDGSTIKTAKSTETRKSRSPSENGSVISNESGKPSSGRRSPQNVMAQQKVTKEEARKRNVPASDEEEGAVLFDNSSKVAAEPFDTSSGSVQLIAIKPTALPVVPPTSDRSQESSAVLNGEVNKALKQKSDIEHYRNKLRLKAKRKGYYDFPAVETSKGLTERKKMYEKAPKEMEHVLDPDSELCAPFTESKNTEPEIIEETNIDRVHEPRGYSRSRQVKGHSETSTLSSQPSIDEVRQQMHMLLEEAFSLASAGHAGQSRHQEAYGSAQHLPYSEVVTSAPGTMTRPRAGVQWVPTYRPEMYQYSLPRPAYRFSQLPEMVMGSPPPPVPPRTGPVAVASLRRSTSDIGSKTRMAESAGPEPAQLHDSASFTQMSRGPVSVAQLDQSALNYSGNTVPAVFAIPAANRPGFTGYFIPTPPSSYRNQAWMSYAGENELPSQWADSVPLPGYIEAYPRSRYPQSSPSRLPRQYSQPVNLHPSLEQAPAPSAAASQQSLAENDPSDAPLTNISTAALVKAIREEVAKLAKKQTDMFEFQV
uniref:KIAA1549 like n=1 Tax=Mandrillus leucophaeus TaxID=9568 RepID=A0A2K5XW07_MANLE